MAIAPISAIGGVGAAGGVGGIGGVGAAGGASATGATSGSGFAAELGKGLDAVSGAQANVNNLSMQAATGASIDPAAITVAATQATLMTQLATTVTSKAVSAFNTIMGMQA